MRISGLFLNHNTTFRSVCLSLISVSLWSQVVCVLSHGDMGSVYGTDKHQVSLRQLTLPFTSRSAPTLAGKPKMFFVQACQGTSFQMGCVPSHQRPCQEEEVKEKLEEDAGPVKSETVPNDADFLLGMATVPNCKSFRSSTTGSIYIQELCSQLMISAQRWEKTQARPHLALMSTFSGITQQFLKFRKFQICLLCDMICQELRCFCTQYTYSFECILLFFLFFLKLRGRWYSQCPDTCEQGGEPRNFQWIQTNARAQVHLHQKACPQTSEKLNGTKCSAESEDD